MERHTTIDRGTLATGGVTTLFAHRRVCTTAVRFDLCRKLR